MLNTKHTVSVAVLLSVITASQDHKIIPAESGQNITLTCRASNTSIVAVEWSKSNMKTDYVLLSRDGHFDLHNQHPSFKDRVDLQDRQMKDGDVSLILNNVTVNDTGTYECRVFMEETHLWKSISTINLSVIVPTGSPGALVEGRSVNTAVSTGFQPEWILESSHAPVSDPPSLTYDVTHTVELPPGPFPAAPSVV